MSEIIAESPLCVSDSGNSEYRSYVVETNNDFTYAELCYSELSKHFNLGKSEAIWFRFTKKARANSLRVEITYKEDYISKYVEVFPEGEEYGEEFLGFICTWLVKNLKLELDKKVVFYVTCFCND